MSRAEFCIARLELLPRRRTNQVEPKKFLQDLQKRNGLIEIYDQLASEKVVEFLQKNAAIEEVPAGSLAPAQA